MQGFSLSRRKLLFSAGAGVLGVSVLYTLSACSGSDETPGGASSGPAPSDPASGPTSGPASGPASSGPGGIGDWRRVDLSFVSAYVLVRGGEAAVVDLGTGGSAGAIGDALTAAGSGWNAVRHVILTHQHQDHAGGLGDVQPLATAATTYAGEADLSAINSAKPLRPLKDGDEVFGLQIIGTPGHTAGHICVFEPATGVLVAGDALGTTDGLTGSNPQYTADQAQAAASVKKLAQLDVRTILPGHGNPLTTGAAEALQKLAASL